jgi:peptidoglycan/xylan/chitin deacetylase (PgdA/CDA1 family)
VSEATGPWPGGARGALSLSFDNLGEAAELELGAIGPDAELGGHFTATRVLPSILRALASRDLAATFFVEGLNTELYPEALMAIDAGGHELAYHAWRHEQWAELSAAEQAENLARGLEGFDRLGLAMAGLRPPGGGLGPGGLGVLREAGLRYCSPAGEGAGAVDRIALLPFQWRHVDATCVLPPLGAVRERMSGSSDPLDPGAFVANLEGEVERLARDGGYMTILLHSFMLDWLGEDRFEVLLDLVARASLREELWVARCADAADHVLARPEPFRDGTALDSTSWSG